MVDVIIRELAVASCLRVIMMSVVARRRNQPVPYTPSAIVAAQQFLTGKMWAR